MYAPASVVISDGTHTETFSVSGQGSGTLRWLDFNVSGLGLQGDQISVTLNRYQGLWVFSDEIQIFGTASAVPEPSTFLLALTGGIGAFAYGSRRKRLPRNRNK